jgi:hypothetical protein
VRSDRADLRLEQNRIDCRTKIVVGDELENSPSALGHFGPLRRFSGAAEIAIGDDLDDVPLGVGIKSFFYVRSIQDLQNGFQVVPGFNRQGVSGDVRKSSLDATRKGPPDDVTGVKDGRHGDNFSFL